MNDETIAITIGVKNEVSFATNKTAIPANGKLEITLKGNDGFVAMFE